MPARAFVRDCLPPLLVRWLQQMRARGITFSGDYPTWATASAAATGYDADAILARVRDATLRVKRGEAAFERDSVTFDKAEYVWPLLAGLMAAAARNQGRLSVLDFGGALGSTYFQHRRFLDGLAEARWSVVEQAHYAKCGAGEVADDVLRFYPDISSCLAEQSPDVILLSGVLQYLPEPMMVLDELGRAGAGTLLIGRTPFSGREAHHLLVQHVPASIYQASYPMWVFSEPRMLESLAQHWCRVSRFDEPEGRVRSREGLPFEFAGMLLEAR